MLAPALKGRQIRKSSDRDIPSGSQEPAGGDRFPT